MFPGKRDRRWFLMLPVIWVTLVVVILIVSSSLLDFFPGKLDFAVSGALGLVAAASVCGFGYAGLKFASSCCAVGIISGIFYMSHIFMNGEMELKGLIGLISGAQLAFVFFLVGINGQMISHIINKRRTVHE